MLTYMHNAHDLNGETSQGHDAGRPLSAADSMQTIGTGEDRGEKNPFDRWLTQKIHSVFDAISKEPLPQDLQNLVQQLDAKEKKSTVQFVMNFETDDDKR